ncbi:MAG: 2-C-methyl-D-erythritol 2,4-cyclodiphosphate synthase [Acidobacteriaceae bacterium]|nr:2-C-methyl-D-erythritol 2,4-cyclodiphosphate synthase [Acidobacteriaceae bacterium]
MSMRIGYGFDSHLFKAGVPLVIGGLAIEHDEGLAGHSDGDVLLHAITDALLGAVSAGDIGSFFPPNDPRWKGAASSVFLQTALEEIATAGYKIVNIDTVLIMARPKISPIAGELRERVAELLGVKPGEVGIKAKTPEGLGLDHTAVAHCTVLLESLDGPDTLGRMAASADAGSEEELNAVVEGLIGDAHDLSALGRKIKPFDTDDLT